MHYRTVFGRFLPKSSTFREKRIAPGRKINKCMSDGCPRVLFLRYDYVCTGFANCSDPRTASGHHGGEQRDPQPLLWYSIPASCIPHTEGGSEEMLCSPSASGFRSRALQPAVLLPDGAACVSRKTLFPAPQALDSRGVHRGLLVSLAFTTTSLLHFFLTIKLVSGIMKVQRPTARKE